MVMKKIAKRKSARKKWPINKIESTFFLTVDEGGGRGNRDYKLIKRDKGLVCKEVGNIELNEHVISHSEIHADLRGKGIGKWFYEQILLHNKKLITEPSSTSKEARRVHKSLMKKWCHKVDIYGEDKDSCNEPCIIYYPKLRKEIKK